MGKLTVLFTKRKWNAGSFLIRWCLPRTRFHAATASHCLIEDGDYVIEAHMKYGVRRVHRDVALKGLTVVKRIEFDVPDASKGMTWARNQVGLPYDWSGALGLALAPGRNWMEPDKWFCFELAAAALSIAGRDAFSEEAGHITGAMLMAIKPTLTNKGTT